MNSLRGAQQTDRAEQDRPLQELSEKKKKKGLQRCKLKWSLWSVFLVKSSSFAPARSGVDDFGVSDINNHQLSATDVVSWNLFNGHFVQHSTRLVPGGDLIKVL